MVESKIQSEVEAGRLVGPLSLSWRQVLQCRPLGLVPKAQPGRFRTIVNLSSPRDSVNSGISEEICSVSYATLDDVVGLIKRLGPMTQLVKWTLKMRTRWYLSIHMISNSWLLYGARTFMLIAVLPLNSTQPPRSSQRWLMHWLGPFTQGGFDICFTTWTLLVPQALSRDCH